MMVVTTKVMYVMMVLMYLWMVTWCVFSGYKMPTVILELLALKLSGTFLA